MWLLTVRDELIYREGVYRSREQAAAAYRQHGVSLGMGEEESPGAVTGRVQKSPLPPAKVEFRSHLHPYPE